MARRTQAHTDARRTGSSLRCTKVVVPLSPSNSTNTRTQKRGNTHVYHPPTCMHACTRERLSGCEPWQRKRGRDPRQCPPGHPPHTRGGAHNTHTHTPHGSSSSSSGVADGGKARSGCARCVACAAHFKRVPASGRAASAPPAADGCRTCVPCSPCTSIRADG